MFCNGINSDSLRIGSSNGRHLGQMPKMIVFISRNCLCVAFCNSIWVFDCILRFSFSCLSLCYGHGVVMVFCSSWHRPCSAVKWLVSVVLGNFVLVNS